MDNEVVKNICYKIDSTIQSNLLDNGFLESLHYAIDIFDNLTEQEKNFVLDIHNEISGFIASYIVNHQDFNFEADESIIVPKWLVEYLREIKEENIEFWN